MGDIFIWQICKKKYLTAFMELSFSFTDLAQNPLAGLPPPPPHVSIDEDPVISGVRSELEELAAEIRQLQSDYGRLQKDCFDRERDAASRKQEVESMETEVAALRAAVKQLELQKDNANKRLLELEQQKTTLEAQVMLR